MATKTGSQTSKTDTSGQPQAKKKTDGLLIAAIVIIVLAAVCFIISVAILFAFADRADLVDKRGQLLAAGSFFILALIAAVVVIIMIFIFISRKRKGLLIQNSSKYVLLGFAIATAVFLLIASVLTFVTSNQAPDSAAGLRAAGAFGLLAFLFLAVGFVIVQVRSRQQIKASTRASSGGRSTISSGNAPPSASTGMKSA